MNLRPLCLTLLLALPGSSAAQSFSVEGSRLLGSPAWSSLRLGMGKTLVGPIGYELFGLWMGNSPGLNADLWGPGLDLTLFRGGRPGFYLAGGIAGGLATGDAGRYWSSWSAGMGYELLPWSFFSLSAEGRWRHLHFDPGHSGLELGLRLGVIVGHSRPAGDDASRSAAMPPLPAVIERSGLPADRASVIEPVLQTAMDAMGTPYKWGGNGTADGGFDCSGLIQYAYGQHGIALPRRSVDQAREGEAVPRELDALLPGDILTFSSSGGPVTHVGLYLGDGRFIHSASDGVRISRLAPDDPYGKWWFKRWVGARRIVG